MQRYEYRLDGWQPAEWPAVPAYVTDAEELGDWLYQEGYKRLAQSGPGRCNVGHFYLWRQEEPRQGWPQWAVEVDQVGADAVVWVETLPALWEFLHRYASIGFSMHRWLEGDEEETPDCPECGEPRTLVGQPVEAALAPTCLCGEPMMMLPDGTPRCYVCLPDTRMSEWDA